jgi:glycosyltransferase involved in cell wall biosynthesis
LKLYFVREGELVRAFEHLGPVTLLDNDTKDPRCTVDKLWRHFWRWPSKGVLINSLLSTHNRDSIGLVYSKTITNGHIVQALSELGLPVVCHVHELSNVIDTFGSKNLNQNKCATQHYIACTHAVKENLVENYSIPNEGINVVHEFIALNIEKQRDRKDTSKRIREQLKLPEDAFVVVGAGTFQERKGPDIFGELAAYVCRNSRPVPTHFIWLGEPWDRRLYNNTVGEVANIGLQSRVHFLGSVVNPLDYFAAADAFALTSREDPFPLVCLEAASMAAPILCFDKSGGSKEFVETDAGGVLPYLNIEAMGDKIIELIKEPGLREQLGQRGAEKVRERFEVSVGAPKLIKIIERYLA